MLCGLKLKISSIRNILDNHKIKLSSSDHMEKCQEYIQKLLSKLSFFFMLSFLMLQKLRIH